MVVTRHRLGPGSWFDNVSQAPTLLAKFCSYRKEDDGSKTMQHPLCISFGSQGASP